MKTISTIDLINHKSGFDPHLLNRIVSKLFLFCFGTIITVDHQENLSKAQHPIIFAYNHNNYYETVLLSSYLINRWQRQKISFLVDWMYGNLPLIGWFINGMQPVYVYTKRARWNFLTRRKTTTPKNIIHACLERLEQGCSLGIFPEGTRNKNPFLLKRGRRGVGEIALRSQTPVLPVGIDFPGRVRDGKIPRFGRIIFRFGEPLHFPGEITAWQEAQHNEELSPQKRKKVWVNLCGQVTHRIMGELARLSGKCYPFRQPQLLGSWQCSQSGLDTGEDDDGKNRHSENCR